MKQKKERERMQVKNEKERINEMLEDISGQLFNISDYPAITDYQRMVEKRLYSRINAALEEMNEEEIKDIIADKEEARDIFLFDFFEEMYKLAEKIEKISEKEKSLKMLAITLEEAYQEAIHLYWSFGNTLYAEIFKSIKSEKLKDACFKLLDELLDYLTEALHF